MTRTGHHLTGLAAGLAVAGLLHARIHPAGLVAIPAGWLGGVAPDRLEYAGRLRWVSHRTLTHWGVPWFALAAWTAWLMVTAPGAPSWLACALAGFTAGGLSHLFGDWPNPLGVPWWLPHRTHSLNWWTSGQYEWLIVPAAFGLAWLAWLTAGAAKFPWGL